MNARFQENVGPVDSLTADNAAVLLIDHQVGHMRLVRDMSPEEFKNNIVGLAKTHKRVRHAGVLTTSCDYGPNAPILPELK